MSVPTRVFAALIACSLTLLVGSSQAMANHDCDEGHYQLEETSTSAEPPTSCLGLDIVGEMEGCDHARLRIDNQCDGFIKMLDDTQAYCELTGEGSSSECQVIASGFVGYVDIPWRKVVNTESRQEHRYDMQVDGRQTFVFVSFESTRLDTPGAEEEGSDSGDDRGCTTAAAGGPGSAWLSLVVFALGLLGLRRRFNSASAR